MKSRRIKAIVLAVLFASFMILFNAFAIAETNHDCAGEQCEICRVLEVVETTKKSITYVAVSTAIALAVIFAAVSCIVYCFKQIFSSTLISLKVKLSD